MSRVAREKRTVAMMISLYCKRKEGNGELCDSCKELIAYALSRLENCKYSNGKTSCNHCPTHCYKPIMREKIRQVMRFSGPRMIIYAPIEALRHLMKF